MKDKIEKAKRIIFVVSGGVGRNIFATAVVRNLKKAYPNKDIILVCGCPDVFQNNPYTKRIYSFDKPQHLFEDYIFENSDSVIIDVEPYRHPEYIAGTKHIIECWCDMLEIPCDSIKPELFFVKSEKEMSQAYLTKYKKPLILIQHIGGKAPEKATPQDRIMAKDSMYRRGLNENTVQKLVNLLRADGYLVGCVQHPNQFLPKDAELIHFPLRATMGLIPYVEGIICIDSFLQHASAALDIKSLVCWAGTNPDKLGYPTHINMRRKSCLTPECHRPNSYAFDIQPSGAMWSCPYSEECSNYEAEEILNTYKELKGDRYTEATKTKEEEEIAVVEEKKEIDCDSCKGE